MATTHTLTSGFIPAASYRRISDDREGRELGVTRQREDIEKLAADRGFTIVADFEDNDIGASRYSRKPRPAYLDMIERAKAGEFKVILGYTNSRLTRRPRENEDLIDLAEHHGIRVVTVRSGEDNYNSADGRMVARIKGDVDAAEAERISERVRRKGEQIAEQGRRHGRVPWGWRVEFPDPTDPTRKVQVLDPVAAPLIREAAERVLAGQALNRIISDWNERGVTPRHGGRWTSTQLHQVLVREANAARRVFRGQVLRDATWPAILDDATFDRVKAILSDPSRAWPRGRERQHLLVGLARCGRPECGATLGSTVAHSRSATGEAVKRHAYTCKRCNRLQVPIAEVDDLITEAVRASLSDPEDAVALLGGDPQAVLVAEEEVAGLRARLDTAALDYAEGLITAEQLRLITATLRPRIDAARARALRAQPARHLTRFAGGTPEAVAAAWADASLDEKRELIRHLMDITILPAPHRGARFTPQRVRIDAKGRRA